MKNNWDKANVIINLFTFMVLLFGALIAVKALVTYQAQTEELNKANKIQIGLSLRSAENEIYKVVSEEKYLMAFFAAFPEGQEPSIKIARQQVNLFLDNNKIQNWNNVADLESLLYGSDNFQDPNKVKLRLAYDLAEHLLYLLQDAYIAKQQGILTDEEFYTFNPYIDDVGFNPMFLSAISYGHSSGYMTKGFSKHLKETLVKNERNKKVIGIIYRDMLNPDWIDQLGKRK